MALSGPALNNDNASGGSAPTFGGRVGDTGGRRDASIYSEEAATLGLDTGSADWSKLQFGLADLFFEAQSAIKDLDGPDQASALDAFESADPLAPVSRGFVAIDVTSREADGAALLVSLKKIGLVNGASFGAVASGLLPLEAIDELAALDVVTFASPAYAITASGSVLSQDDVAIGGDLVRASGVDGSGVTIGILSDSFDTSANPIRYAQDIASGDLPAGVNLLDDTVTGSDEGRGMAQLIHDIAPGAGLAFHTAFSGQAAFAQGIIELRAAGADIIVDDVSYFTAPFFQDGVIAQAVDQVAADGALYFSSAGNQGTQAYESEWRNSGESILSGGQIYILHDFDPGVGVDTTQSVTMNGNTTLALQWDDPFVLQPGDPGSDSDLAIIITSTTGTVLQVMDVDNRGFNAVELGSYFSTQTVNISIGMWVGPNSFDPGRFKYANYGPAMTFNEWNSESGTVSGHAAAQGAIAVGAADWNQTPAFGANPPIAENFTSKGGVTILFDTAGARLATPEFRTAVDFTAPNGGNTTFFGTDVPYDADTFPNFYGTSAAAPNAAALAALLKQAYPTATPAQILQAMTQSATDILENKSGKSLGAGYDLHTGAGLIEGSAALAALAALVSPVPNDDRFATDDVTAIGGNLFADNGFGIDTGPSLAIVQVDGDAGKVGTAFLLASGALVTVNANGIFTYDPNGALERYPIGKTIDELFEYTVTGGGTATVQVTVTALDNDDLFEGTEGNDSFFAGLGNDTIYGLGGNDAIDGGSGADTMLGGAGDDEYWLDQAGDTVTEYAGEGYDTAYFSFDFRANAANFANIEAFYLIGTADEARTNNGDNELYANPTLGSLLLAFGGNDLLVGGTGDDVLVGGTGNDTMRGGLGNDRYFVIDPGDVVIELAGEGIDEIRTNQNTTLGDNLEDLRLRGAASIGTGNAADNTIFAGSAAATLSGLAGNDTLYGSASADTIDGGDDNDTLFGNAGADTLNGGNGDDILNGGSQGDTLNGGPGDDRLRGNEGLDTLNGDAGRDRLEGGDNPDVLRGGADNDVLLGQEGNDQLFGDEGDDRLTGGTGRDRMTGGTGQDDFLFGEGDFAGLGASDSDRILDFSDAEGDLIDLSAVDAITGGSDDAFTFIGDAAFSNTAGELRYETGAGYLLVQGDTDGDAAADFAIRVDTLTTLVESNFVL